MANFAYTARDSSGASVNGVVEADSLALAQQMLRAEGKYPTSIRQGTTPGPAAGAVVVEAVGSRGVKMARADVIQFATQLSIMIETGVVLSEALEAIATQANKPNVKKLVGHLSHTVSEGKDFSYALSCHPRTFSRMFIAIMQAAEKSGMLAKMLHRATGYLRDEQDTVRRVRGALTYPGIMLAFAVTTTIFLLAFVLPRFTMIYASKKAALPIPTKVLMDLSDFVCHNWIALVSGAVVAGVGGFFYFRTNAGAVTWHYLQLRIPLLGKMYRKMHLSRGLRMIGTLAGAGVPLVDCVGTARDLCSNTYFKNLWTKVSDEIHDGQQLSQPMFASNLVPRSVAQMLSCGEKGGKLGQVMEQVAGFAEQELKEQIADMTRYIEPAMIVLMGFIIGGVAMALLLPIFTISKVMAS